MDVICGMDVHENSILMLGSKPPVKGVYENTDESRLSLIKHLENQQKKNAAGKIYAVYEACCFGFNLCGVFQRHGLNCFRPAPAERKDKTGRPGKKTDSRDALALYEILQGHLLAGNPLPPMWQADKAIENDAFLIKGMLGMKKEIPLIKAKIQTFLKQCGLKNLLNGETGPMGTDIG